MGWLTRVAKSSIGAKWIMALTGLGLVGFLIAHLSGNLLVYSGQDATNAYAVGLRALPYGALWVLRIGTLVAFVVHIATAFYLTKANRAARPQQYVCKNTIQASFASRTMPYTGLLVLLYLIYHLLHFTFRSVNNTGEKLDALGRPDVYSMVIEGFHQPGISIVYILSMLVLGLHLNHGISSAFQTLGINQSKYNRLIRTAGPLIGWVIVLAFISIPVSVWLGLVGA